MKQLQEFISILTGSFNNREQWESMKETNPDFIGGEEDAVLLLGEQEEMVGGVGVSFRGKIALLHHKDAGKILRQAGDLMIAGRVHVLRKGKIRVGFFHGLPLLPVVEGAGEN